MKIGNFEINPTKIICLGRNYLDHAKESGSEAPKEPILFAKTPNCLILNNEPIIYPKMLFEKRTLNRVDHEVELAVIIKTRCKQVSKENALNYVLGYTVFNDVTARKVQLKAIRMAHPWYLSKSMDTFGPIGPKIATPEEIGDPHDLHIELKASEKSKQILEDTNLPKLAAAQKSQEPIIETEKVCPNCGNKAPYNISVCELCGAIFNSK